MIIFKNVLQNWKPLLSVVSAIKGQANRPRLKVLFEKLKNKLQKMKYAGIWTMDTSRFQIMDKRPVFLLSDIQISKNISYNFLVQKVSYRTIRYRIGNAPLYELRCCLIDDLDIFRPNTVCYSDAHNSVYACSNLCLRLYNKPIKALHICILVKSDSFSEI